jgi:glucosyl-dolichyl phosphate glucuronosyltransferase
VTISVVIATYNRAALLGECLDHLARQRFAPGDEAIVVDNGSTDDTRRTIEAARARFPVPLHALHEPAPGKSRAIARALSVAAGDVLAFTDDDVNVEAGWLDAIRAAMRDPDVALAGGPVKPRWERTPPRWLHRTAEANGVLGSPLAIVDYGPAAIDLGPRTLLGANMAVRRGVFTALGGFAPHLGKLRGTLLSGEDHELCRLVQASGLRAVYAPSAIVRHWVPAARMRLGYYLSWFFWSGITHATLEAGRTRGRSFAGIPLYLFRRAAVRGGQATAALLAGDVRRSVECAVDVAYAAGYASRACRAPRSRSRAGGDALRAAATGGGAR